MPAQTSHKPPVPLDGAPSGVDPAGQRADARRNRERVLEAAREAFAVQGTDAPMSTVARRAGVGVATLYRHFPTRAALVTAAFEEQLSVCAATLDDALADPDPGHGLRVLLEKVGTMQATERGFTAVFMDRFPEARDFDDERARAEDGLARLVERARENGQLRDDFDPADITLLLLAVGGLADQPRDVALAASRRLVAYFLQAIQVRDAGPLPPPAAMGLRAIGRPPGRR